MSKKSSLALIVPCYNEVDAIPAFENEVVLFKAEFEKSCPDTEFKLLFVDNNSTDGSGSQLQALGLKYEYIKYESCRVQGYGAALKHGFSAVDSDYFCFLDLDNTYPLIDIIKLLKKLKQEDLDMVYGARIHSQSDIPLVREIGNRLYVILLRYLLRSKLTDVCSGMRIFKGLRRNQVTSLESDSLAFSIELTAHAVIHHWKISESPIEYRSRIGESKLSVLRDGVVFLWVCLSQYFSGKK